MNQVQLTPEQMMARIAELEAQVKSKPKSASIKVSPKGAVSVYGLGRFPVTLYASQWESLFGKQDEIKQFIIDNLNALAAKDSQAKDAQADTPAEAQA